MNPESKIMNPIPAKRENLATMPFQKIKVKKYIVHILCLPGGQRVVIHSDQSFQVWDLERGMQVGEECEDEEYFGVSATTLSPDGKTMAIGSYGTLRLWSVDMGKVIKKWTGDTNQVESVCWGPDGGRVVIGSKDGTFRVWDVKSGETIIGPIVAGEQVYAVCYSPNTKMIATGGDVIKIWNANTGELLKTINCYCSSLAWASDGKILFAGRFNIDTATWTVIHERRGHDHDFANTILLSPNGCILASISYVDKTAQLWDAETNQPIGTLLYHGDPVFSAAFSTDGKFLITSCDFHIYAWDVSAIVKEACLLRSLPNSPLQHIV